VKFKEGVFRLSGGGGHATLRMPINEPACDFVNAK